MANPNQSGGGSRGDSNRESQSTNRENLSKEDRLKRGLENEDEIRDVSNESGKSSTDKRDLGKDSSGSGMQGRGSNLGNKEKR